MSFGCFSSFNNELIILLSDKNDLHFVNKNEFLQKCMGTLSSTPCMYDTTLHPYNMTSCTGNNIRSHRLSKEVFCSQNTIAVMTGLSTLNPRHLIQFLALYIPVFFFVHTNTAGFSGGNQFHRSATVDYLEVTERFQVTLTGVPGRKPENVERRYLEHVLFSYLNIALTTRKYQISSVEIDVDQTILKDISSQSAFTVISSTSSIVSANRRKGEMIDPQENVEDLSESDQERELQQEGKGSSANKLFVEVVVNGRDYSMVEGRFKKGVKSAINLGHKGIIEMLVAPAQAEEYFKGVNWVGAVIIPSGMSRVQNVQEDEPSREDPATLFDESDEGETREGSIGTTSPSDLDEGVSEEAVDDFTTKEKRAPMNSRAARFRTISGSIFISFCITVVLANTLRIASKKRDERKRRMQKAKQAYEGPKETVASKRMSERFVGMLDDGAIPTR